MPWPGAPGYRWIARGTRLAVRWPGKMAAAHKAATELVEVKTALLGEGHWAVADGALNYEITLRLRLKLDDGQLRRLAETANEATVRPAPSADTATPSPQT